MRRSAFLSFVPVAAIALALAAPARAQILEGNVAGDRYGADVAWVGDVNDDGYADFVVGAPDNDQSGDNAGAVYLYLGRYGRWPAAPSLTILGQTGGDEFGTAVAAAGDLNHDGYDDFLVGAPGRDTGGQESGRVYLYLGGASPNGTADATWDGDWPGAHFGADVAGGFDFNNDNRPDFVVGAPDHSETALRAGQVSLFFGGVSLPTAPAYAFTGDQANWALGHAVDGAGDVNGDGYDDIIAGAPQPFDLNTGRALIWLGRASTLGNPTRIELTGQTGGDRFGWDVSGAGDVNSDNRDDVLVGAPRYALDNGAAYVFHGGSSMNTQYDWRMTGADGGDELGYSVDGGFDMNGDGKPDLAVGAPGTDIVAAAAGRVFVVYGKASLPSSPDRTIDPEAPVAGFTAGDRFGECVRFVGSYNGDGFAELLAAAPEGNGASGAETGYANLLAYDDTFVPVTLARFTAIRSGGATALAWALVDAADVVALRVDALEPGSMPRAVGAGWLAPDARELEDSEGTASTTYRLVALDRASVETVLGEAATTTVAARPGLAARANPFRGEVALTLTTAADGPVEVAVRDAAGRLVRTLWRGTVPAGSRSLAWTGEDDRGRTAPPGVYFVTVSGASGTTSMKLVRLP